MGILGGKKTYYSSSVVYNMAGDEENRIQFLKTMVATGIIGSRDFSMPAMMERTYLNGPGIKTRSFHRWCRMPGKYDKVKIPSLKLSTSYGIDMVAVGTYVPRGAGQTVEVTYVKTSGAEFTAWAEQWILANDPSKFDTEWIATQDFDTEEITIQWADLTTTTFMPVNYEPTARYVYVVYKLKEGSTFLGSLMWIYRTGDGIGYLDSLLDQVDDGGECLPLIPIRLEKKFLSDTHYPEVFKQTTKAYTKATGKRGKKGLPALIKDIKENDDIDDIDHIYMVHGVAINAKDNSARKYLFKFFDYLRTAQTYDHSAYEAWEAEQADYEAEVGTIDPSNSETIPPAPVSPITSIEYSNPAGFNVKGSQLKFVITWKSIKKETGAGLGKPGAKVGECWWGTSTIKAVETTLALFGADASFVSDNSTIYLYKQVTKDSWEKISIHGMYHENFAHRKQPVIITAAEGLADDEESGCLMPIHYGLLRQMSLVDSTQMMTAGTYLVFNCFTVVKQKWYQTTIFKIFVFVVIIAIAVIFPPSIGLLGPAATVGAAVGFTGLMAIIVGTIINTLAAMILMRLISTVSVAIFGDKIGAIIGAIVSVAAMSFTPAALSGGGLAAGWGNMMSAQGILGLTSAIGNGIAGWMQASAQEFAIKTQQVLEDYEKQSKEINDLFTKLLGTSGFGFDPMNLTNAGATTVGETPQMFLDRTLLCGSDIAEMTKTMLNEFASSTLSVNTIGS